MKYDLLDHLSVGRHFINFWFQLLGANDKNQLFKCKIYKYNTCFVQNFIEIDIKYVNKVENIA